MFWFNTEQYCMSSLATTSQCYFYLKSKWGLSFLFCRWLEYRISKVLPTLNSEFTKRNTPPKLPPNPKVISSSTNSTQKTTMANILENCYCATTSKRKASWLRYLGCISPALVTRGQGKGTEFYISTQWCVLPQSKGELEAGQPKSLAVVIMRIGIKWKDLWYLLRCQLRGKKLFPYYLWSALSG